MKKVLLIVVIALLLICVSGTEDDEDYGLYREATKFVNFCRVDELSLCLKERALKYVESLPSNLDLGGGFKIRQNSIDDDGGTFRSKSIVLPDEARARESVLNDALMERILDYARSHTLEFQLPLNAFRSTGQAIEEGRKRKGHRRGFIFLLYLKAAMMGAMALKAISLMALKALIVAKIALAISGLIGIKKLLEQNHHTSYEVVAHGYDDHSRNGHYDRSFAHDMAYKASGIRSRR